MRFFAGSIALLTALTGWTTSAPVTAAAVTTVVTISGNTLVVPTPMDRSLQGQLCQSPTYSCQALTYEADAIATAPLEAAVVELRRILATQTGPAVVLAHSQGTMIASSWLARYGAQAGRFEDVSFVMLGSPQHGRGGVGLVVGSAEWPPTPTDSGYTVIEVAREYDMQADFPTYLGNWAAVVNAYSGYWGVHTDYVNVDLRDPNNLVTQVGGTTFVLVPTEHLPMLQPLRWFGQTTLADALDDLWKPIVDAGYDRSGYVTLARAWQDGYVLPDALAAGDGTATRVSAQPEIARSDPAGDQIEAPTEDLDPPAEDDDAPTDDGEPTETAETESNRGDDADEVEQESSANEYPRSAGPKAEPEADAGPEDGPDQDSDQRTDAGQNGAPESSDQPADPA